MLRVLITSLCIFLAPYLIADDIDIFDAARNGDLQEIENYVASSNSLDVKNGSSYTPFILATYYGRNDAAELLLKHGANACVLDEKGSNAYMGVAFKGHLETAEWLLENTDCDINHRNYAGQTALMMAALFDREDILQLFIDHDADVTVRDYKGNSAESLAAGQGLSGVIEKIRFVL